MKFAGLSVWGDSIAKGVIFDEARGRYAVCRENCLQRLSREDGISIENHAVMGQTSDVGLERMCAAGENGELEEGRVAVIEYGGNDCDLDWRAVSEHPEREQFGKVPLERFVRNLAGMVARAREAKMLPVLVTPPPLVARRYFDWICRGLNGENILKYLGDVDHIYRWQENYARQVRALADALNVCLVDIRTRLLEGGDLEEMMCVDGIHPNARGHECIYEMVEPMLAAHGV